MRTRYDEAGVVGKIIVVWLVIVALLGVIALDGGSILFTRFRLSDTAQTAAAAAAAAYKDTPNEAKACQTALQSIQQDDPQAAPPAAVKVKGWCKVSPKTGEVTITLHKKAKTILAYRIGFTEGFTKVVVVESGGPSSL
jgi:uncharacterized membrane protein